MFNHRGFEIAVTDRGQFLCQKDDLEITTYTLKEMQEKIDRIITAKPKTPLALPVVGILQRPTSRGKTVTGTPVTIKPPLEMFATTVNGINRTSRNLQFDNLPKGAELDDVIPDTPANRELTVKYLHTKADWDEISEKRRDLELGILGYGRIDVEDYDNWVKTLTDQHKEKSK